MALVELAAGTIAGFGICAVGHPFDTCKVLMQMQPGKYTGFIDVVKQTVAKHGVMSLYRGVAAPLAGSGFYNAVQFATFSRLKALVTDGGRNDSLGRIAGAAAVTGIFVALVEGPQDLVKSQMQAQMMTRPAATAAGASSSSAAPAAAVRYASTLDCARTLYRTGGIAAFGQGLSATIARNVVGVSAYFWAYEAVRRRLAGSERSVESLGPAETLLAGGCGGVAYWVLAYPGDIVKSAMQTDAIEPAARKYRSVGQTAALLWAEGGARRFTAGIVPCLLRSFPANAAGFLCYEVTKKSLQ